MNKKEISLITVFTPLSVTLAATAVVFQQAMSMRSSQLVDDEILRPVLDWIHPVALTTLLLGYLLSVTSFGLYIHKTRISARQE